MIKKEMGDATRLVRAGTMFPTGVPTAGHVGSTKTEAMKDGKLPTPIPHGVPSDTSSSVSRSSVRPRHQQQQATVKEEPDDDLEVIEVRAV